MASPSAIQQPQPSSTNRSTFSVGDHTELISIEGRPFFLPQISKLYRECHVESLPCCPSGLPDQQAKEAAQRICDKTFGPGRWLDGSHIRRPPEKPPTRPCREWSWALYDRFAHHSSRPGAKEPTLNSPNHECHGSRSPLLQSPLQSSYALETGASHQPGTHQSSPLPDNDRIFSAAAIELPSSVDRSSLPPAKRRRIDRSSSKEDPVAKAAKDFVTKIQKGLEKLGKPARGTVANPRELGAELNAYASSPDHDKGKTLEGILGKHAKAQISNAWLVDILHRYTCFWRRRVDDKFSETGDHEKEGKVRAKEMICEVMSSVVNGLAPSWGGNASLIFGALEETRFKAASLRDLKRSSAGDVAESIKRALSTINEVAVWKHKSVMDPALFISCVERIPYSQVCIDLGMENMAQYDPQHGVDFASIKLVEVGLDCGRTSLSKLMASNTGWTVSKPDIQTLRLRATDTSARATSTMVENTSRRSGISIEVFAEAVEGRPGSARETAMSEDERIDRVTINKSGLGTTEHPTMVQAMPARPPRLSQAPTSPPSFTFELPTPGPRLPDDEQTRSASEGPQYFQNLSLSPASLSGNIGTRNRGPPPKAIESRLIPRRRRDSLPHSTPLPPSMDRSSSAPPGSFAAPARQQQKLCRRLQPTELGFNGSSPQSRPRELPNHAAEPNHRVHIGQDRANASSVPSPAMPQPRQHSVPEIETSAQGSEPQRLQGQHPIPEVLQYPQVSRSIPSSSPTTQSEGPGVRGFSTADGASPAPTPKSRQESQSHVPIQEAPGSQQFLLSLETSLPYQPAPSSPSDAMIMDKVSAACMRTPRLVPVPQDQPSTHSASVQQYLLTQPTGPYPNWLLPQNGSQERPNRNTDTGLKGHGESEGAHGSRDQSNRIISCEQDQETPDGDGMDMAWDMLQRIDHDDEYLASFFRSPTSPTLQLES